MTLSEPGGRLAMDDDLLRIARRVFEKAQKRRLDYQALSALNIARRS
jgi:hypothetical protein